MRAKTAVQWGPLYTGVFVLIGEMIEPIRLELSSLGSKAGGVKVGCKWRRGRPRLGLEERKKERKKVSGSVPTSLVRSTASMNVLEPHLYFIAVLLQNLETRELLQHTAISSTHEYQLTLPTVMDSYLDTQAVCIRFQLQSMTEHFTLLPSSAFHRAQAKSWLSLVSFHLGHEMKYVRSASPIRCHEPQQKIDRSVGTYLRTVTEHLNGSPTGSRQNP